MNVIKVPFKLITGVSDYIFPYGDENNKFDNYMQLLDHPLLISCFVINRGIIHPKIFPIPIGITRDIPFIVRILDDETDIYNYDIDDDLEIKDYENKTYMGY